MFERKVPHLLSHAIRREIALFAYHPARVVLELRLARRKEAVRSVNQTANQGETEGRYAHIMPARDHNPVPQDVPDAREDTAFWVGLLQNDV
jgi:hypothetical protein